MDPNQPPPGGPQWGGYTPPNQPFAAPLPGTGNPQREQFRSQAQLPAIFTAIIAGLNALLWGAVCLVGFIELITGRSLSPDRDFNPAETVGALFVCVTLLGVNAAILYGAVRFAQLKSRFWAQASSIAMIVPCTGPCCLLGIPLGIWGLVTASKVPHDVWEG